MLFRKKSKTPLRDLLNEGEIAVVDALLRRVDGLLSTAEHLDIEEKKDVIEGRKVLGRLFFVE